MTLTFDSETNTVTMSSATSSDIKGIRESKFPRMFATQLVYELGFSCNVREAISKDIRSILNSEDSFEDGLIAMAEADMITFIP